ncbi:MAG: phosphoenolpyruvate--protein phosphotransferase [Arenicellaceae bacterium]|nr:phosphoenolpyruvate--protein phosphotransferase [Arenicellaceae bacterium]
MFAIHGNGVGKSIAIGEAYVVHSSDLEVPRYVIEASQVPNEAKRLLVAIHKSVSQLKNVKRRIPKAAAESGAFVDAHIKMLEDLLFKDGAVHIVETQQLNAEASIQIHAENLVNVFDNMSDDYLRNKRYDVLQIARRVTDNLLGVTHHYLDQANKEDLNGKIIVARDLTPAETIHLKNRGVAAFVTDLGGPISHTAIVARSMHIPASVGLHGRTRLTREGDRIIVDGRNGSVLVNPDERTVKTYRKLQRAIRASERSLGKLAQEKSRTSDGVPISLLSNIEQPSDVRAIKQVNAEGVGLYRTEFLFMNRPDFPGEEEQFQAYRKVIKNLGRPITIRTLDIGGDKMLQDTRDELASSSPLGLRAVRYCLRSPDIFIMQLRAILRAAAYGPASILIPMLSNMSEVQQVLEIIDETKENLRREQKRFDDAIPVGGMIEVPAAAVSVEQFADKLDFLSIGSNDLIQYTLAIDRIDDAVNYLYDPIHPAILRLIRNIVKVSDKAGIPVSICGELAGNSRFTRLLLGLDLRIFSMDDAGSLLEIKKVVMQTNVAKARRQVDKMLRTSDPAALRRQLEHLNSLA